MEPETKHSFQGLKRQDHSTKRLIECSIGEELKVLRVNAGYHAKRRLSCLGIIPGIKIIKKKTAPFHGPIEIIVKGSS